MFKIKLGKDWKNEKDGGVITVPGSALELKTWDWRTRRAVWIKENCKQCTLCWPVCPEDCILIDKEQKIRGEFDYEYCKGCGICAKVCPYNAIIMVNEEDITDEDKA